MYQNGNQMYETKKILKKIIHCHCENKKKIPACFYQKL